MPRKKKEIEEQAPAQDEMPWPEEDETMPAICQALETLGYPSSPEDPLPDFVYWETGLPADTTLFLLSEARYAEVLNLLLDVAASGQAPEARPAPKADIRRSEDYRSVARPFSPEQQQAFLKQLYELRHDHDHMQGELDYHKDLAKSAQKRIDKLNEQMHGILKTLEEGRETGEVLCEKVINYDTGLATWFAKDTGEMIHERPLNETEMQREIDFAAPEEEPEPETIEPEFEEYIEEEEEHEPEYPPAA